MNSGLPGATVQCWYGAKRDYSTIFSPSITKVVFIDMELRAGCEIYIHRFSVLLRANNYPRFRAMTTWTRTSRTGNLVVEDGRVAWWLVHIELEAWFLKCSRVRPIPVHWQAVLVSMSDVHSGAGHPHWIIKCAHVLPHLRAGRPSSCLRPVWLKERESWSTKTQLEDASMSYFRSYFHTKVNFK